MIEDRYIVLIQKEITNTISPSEAIDLKQWLGDNQDRQHLYQEIKNVWELTDQYDRNIDIDLASAYENLRSKMRDKSTPHQLYRWVAGIAATIALLTTFMLWQFEKEKMEEEQSVIAMHNDQKIVLPDGTLVFLKKGSKISFPEQFESTRDVRFQGSAFFDVVKDPQKVFSIVGPHSNVSVLGTSFYYEDIVGKNKVDLQLITGEVRLATNDQQYDILRGQSINVDLSNGTKVNIGPIDYSKHTWHQYSFDYNKTRLNQVIKNIESYFNVVVTIESNIKDCLFTGRLPGKNAKETLSILVAVYGAELTFISDAFIIKGGSCK